MKKIDLKQWILKVTHRLNQPIYVGSQVLVSSMTGTGVAGDSWHVAVESPDVRLLEALKYGVNVGYNTYFSNGYHWVYRVTWLGTTSNQNPIYLKLNSIDCGNVSTWSAPTYYGTSGSTFFTEAELGQEPIPTYGYQGITLYYKSDNQNTAVTGPTFTFKDVTLHAYIVSN